MAKTPSGRPADLTPAIAGEIGVTLKKLGAEPDAGSADIYETMRAHGAKSDLLMIVGSYMDTRDDEWVLENLRRWNAEH
jgi:hypothetical protein